LAEAEEQLDQPPVVNEADDAQDNRDGKDKYCHAAVPSDERREGKRAEADADVDKRQPDRHAESVPDASRGLM
jgi:hypothetical protein